MRSAKSKIKAVSLAVLALVLFARGALYGQPRLYSYVGDNGLRVITNIPPPGETLPLEETSSKTASIRLETPSAVPQPAPTRGENEIRWDNLILKYASIYSLEPDLIRAVIKAESNFNPLAISPKGALGLMQLMPDTARRYGVKNVFDAEQNIAGGVSYLYDLLQMFGGNIQLALSAYNAGENLVNRIRRIPPFLETRNYIARINRMFDFQRSPFLMVPQVQVEIPPPKVRRIRHPDGRLEITNIESGPSVATQL
jgi:soluble lytic murein transglycosylase-like protein